MYLDLNWADYFIFTMMLLSLIVNIIKHEQPYNIKYNAYINFVSVIINLVLLRCAGMF